MIEVHNLTVTFNKGTALENPVLRDLDLVIPKGQFVTVIGSNGAGKSTLLSALAGEVPIERGRIAINDQEVTSLSACRRAGLVARVFQDPLVSTCAELSVEENLALAAGRGRRRGLRHALTRTRRDDFRSRLRHLGLGLEDRLADRLSLLSGGQRQVVSLLMATLQPMKILLLDEHTASLDPKTAAFVLQLTRDLIAEHNLTALMVTHSMRQALAIGQRTVMMHQGRIVFDTAGEARSRLDVPDLLKLFEATRREVLADADLLLD